MPQTAPNGPALITGGGGFVAGHLAQHLRETERPVAAPDRGELDLLDAGAVTRYVEEAQPEVVFHLAAFSSPQRSVDRAREAVLSNVEMTVNLLDAVRYAAPRAVVVLASSGQVYGGGTDGPITEDAPMSPLNPYAVSKAACDLLGGQYAASYDLRVVRLRPFNHAGPGQSDEYVVSALARQVAEAEAGGGECLLRTGNVHTRRDFTDVRDIVRAYTAAAGTAGGAFNASSNRALSVGDMVELLRDLARVPVRHEIDPARVRPNEAELVCGSSERLREATGWEPRIPFEETLAATLDWWRRRAG